MIKSARQGAVFIANMTKKSGKMIYEFNIKTGKRKKKYNMLRHLGCIYAMLEIYPYATKKEQILIKQSSKRALDWAVKNKFLEIKDNLAVVEKNQIKLGANAIAIFAFTKWIEIFGDNDLFEGFFPSQVSKKLCSYLLEQVEPDGKIKFHKFNLKTNKPDDFTSNFYPGEIMLSFCMMYEIIPKTESLNLLENAINIMKWLRENRDKDIQIRDHWQLQAMEKLYHYRFSESMKKYISQYAERIAMTEPITPEKLPTVPSGPIAARTEGMIAYYKIKQDKYIAKQIKENIKNLIPFQIKSGKYKGGFKYLLDSNITRIDHTQHGSLALLEYWKMFNNT